MVLATGSAVTRITADTRCAAIFHRVWHSGPLRSAQASFVGAHTDGVLQQYAVFHESELVALPASLTYAEGATLPCAAVTAWNALFCETTRSLRPGDVVLTQGSGGVSVFAIQFAKAAGAVVIATTGELGGEREAKLKQLGASKVVSYRDQDWGSKVKAESPGGRGVDYIVEVSGDVEQSAKTLAFGGQIAVIGGLAKGNAVGFDMRTTMGSLRRIAVGSRTDFEDMNKAIDANQIKPVVDPKTFGFKAAKEAYEYMESGKMWGKVIIQVDEHKG